MNQSKKNYLSGGQSTRPSEECARSFIERPAIIEDWTNGSQCLVKKPERLGRKGWLRLDPETKEWVFYGTATE